MTIRYDENGNPYDDGEYDYSQEAPQDEAPQQEFVSEGDSGGGGGSGDYNYEQDIAQEDPVFVVDEPVVGPIVQEDPVFVAGELSVDPAAQEKSFYATNTTDPNLDSFNYIYDEPKESDVYNEEILTEDPITKPIVAEPVASDPVYADIRMGATSSGGGFRTPIRGEGAPTPIRNFLFGKRRGYTEPEQTIIAARSVDPLAPTSVGEYDYRPASIQGPPPELKGSFPGISVDPIDDGIPTVKMIPANSGGLLAAAVGGQAIGQSGGDPGPEGGDGSGGRATGRGFGIMPRLNRNDNAIGLNDDSVKYDPGVIKMADLPREDMPRPKIFTNAMNDPERILGYGFQQQRILDGKGPKDTAIDKFGRLLPDNGVFPVDNASTMGNESKPIAVREGALPNPMVEGQPRDIEKANAEKEQQRLKDLADWKIIQDKEDAIIKTKKDKDLANQLSEKQLVDSIIKQENHKRDLAITKDPTRNDEEKSKAWERIYKFKDAELATQRKKEQVAHDEAVAEKVRTALNKFRGGTPLGEAKLEATDPVAAEKNKKEAYRAKLEEKLKGFDGPISGMKKDIDEENYRKSMMVTSPTGPVDNSLPKKTTRPVPVPVINRNEGKDEQLGSYSFITSGPNGLTPKMFPLASQVFDATVAEKNLNEMKDMRYKELMDVSPTGALLKSQVKQQAIAKLLDDKSLNRVIDFVNEVHTGVAIGNTTENSTGTSNEISAKVSRSIPGSSMSTGGGTGITSRNKNGSTNIENNWRGQSTNPTIEGSMGASQGETSRSGVGSSLSQTGGNSNKVSNSDNRLANYNSMSKQEQEVVDAILKTSSSARADIEGKYNPAIEKYEEKYKQLKSETSEVGGRLLYLGDVTGAGAAYPKQALDSTSKTAKMNIQQFLNRFNTTNPELQGGLKDISVKHGLFNQGPVDSNMKKRVDQLSNPAIADILDGKTYLPAISNMIQGKLPDIQYEAEKSMYDAEASLRMEQTKKIDTTDPNFWAKHEGTIKSAATNSSFGKAVMAAKVLKAHDDLTQFFTNPSANPAENMMADKRTLAPFNQYLDRLFNAAVMDPKANTVLGATGMEMALRISPYRQELTRIQNLNPVFTDPKNEATKYMIRALADPTNRDVYLQKVKDLDPERYRGIGKPYAPVGNAPARSVPANPAARGIMFQDGKPLLFK